MNPTEAANPWRGSPATWPPEVAEARVSLPPVLYMNHN